MSDKNVILYNEDNDSLFPVPASPINVTESVLYELVTANTLHPDQWYCITNYPDGLAHPYKLYIQACTNNSFYTHAVARPIAHNTYFDGSDLSRWILKIAYTSDFTFTDHRTGSKIRVIYMKDDRNNEANFDLKQYCANETGSYTFMRELPGSLPNIDLSLYDVCHDNVVTLAPDDYFWIKASNNSTSDSISFNEIKTVGINKSANVRDHTLWITCRTCVYNQFMNSWGEVSGDSIQYNNVLNSYLDCTLGASNEIINSRVSWGHGGSEQLTVTRSRIDSSEITGAGALGDSTIVNSTIVACLQKTLTTYLNSMTIASCIIEDCVIGSNSPSLYYGIGEVILKSSKLYKLVLYNENRSYNDKFCHVYIENSIIDQLSNSASVEIINSTIAKLTYVSGDDQIASSLYIRESTINDLRVVGTDSQVVIGYSTLIQSAVKASNRAGNVETLNLCTFNDGSIRTVLTVGLIIYHSYFRNSRFVPGTAPRAIQMMYCEFIDSAVTGYAEYSIMDTIAVVNDIWRIDTLTLHNSDISINNIKRRDLALVVEKALEFTGNNITGGAIVTDVNDNNPVTSTSPLYVLPLVQFRADDGWVNFLEVCCMLIRMSPMDMSTVNLYIDGGYIRAQNIASLNYDTFAWKKVTMYSATAANKVVLMFSPDNSQYYYVKNTTSYKYSFKLDRQQIRSIRDFTELLGTGSKTILSFTGFYN